jgi:integrase
MFFNWLRLEGLYKNPNPVVPGMHYPKCPRRLPRPYSDIDMEKIWRLIEQRGCTQVKLAVAIGTECGLRIGEVLNIRLEDVNLVAQRIRVRLPNKGNREREVPFHERTKFYLGRWLAERNPACAHDFLLYNSQGAPMGPGSIAILLRRALVPGRGDSEQGGPEIFPDFKFHRLRHSWATRLINANVNTAILAEMGGWSSLDSLAKYAEVYRETKERSYADAMKHVQEARRSESRKSTPLLEYARKESTDPGKVNE